MEYTTFVDFIVFFKKSISPSYDLVRYQIVRYPCSNKGTIPSFIGSFGDIDLCP